VTHIYFSDRQKIDYDCLIDTEDLQKLINFNFTWHKFHSKTCNLDYVAASEYLGIVNGKPKYKMIYLHRFLMNADEKTYVDHEDHDSLNNRKYNLRITTNDKNTQHRKGANSNNSTGHRNVNWGWNREFYFVQFMRKGERFIWEFPLDQYQEACDFADIKRLELFGAYSGNN